jgi:hypothetical protein
MTHRREWKWAIAAVILAGLAWQLTRIDSRGLAVLPAPALTMAALASGIALASFAAFVEAWAVLRGRDESWRQVAPGWFGSLLARYLPGGIGQGVARLSAAHAAGEGIRNALERFTAEQLLACFSATVLALALGLVLRMDSNILLALGVLAALELAAPFFATRAGLDVGWNLRALAWMLTGHAALAAGFAVFTFAWFPGADATTLAAAAVVFLMAGIAGLLAVFVPAGLGVREAVLAALLAPRIGAAPAIALALAARVWLIACEVLAWSLVTMLVRSAASAATRDE